MDYVLFGIQGSGKGTQGKILSGRYGLPYFETGGELRKLAAQDSALGKKVKSIIEAGNLVSNEVVMEIVENFLKNVPKDKSIIFDGIPRSLQQAQNLADLLKVSGRDFLGLFFELSREAALERLLARRLCASCKTVYSAAHQGDICSSCGGKLVKRSDDTEVSILTRFANFEKETMPVIERWGKMGKIVRIDGGQGMENVTKEMFDKVKVES